jgi:hypothetical protein
LLFKQPDLLSTTTPIILKLIDRLKNEKRYWECYNIAKVSFQYGYYDLSRDLFGFLSEKVFVTMLYKLNVLFKAESELNYFFLNAMFNISTGEELIKQFNMSDALIYIKASRDDMRVRR